MNYHNICWRISRCRVYVRKLTSKKCYGYLEYYTVFPRLYVTVFASFTPLADVVTIREQHFIKVMHDSVYKSTPKRWTKLYDLKVDLRILQQIR